MFDPSIDLSENREEFKKRLKSRMYTGDLHIRYFHSILENNPSKIKECKDEYFRQKAKVYHYLDLYDAAKTKQEKISVVGSVTSSYDPTQQEVISSSTKDIL